MIKSRLIANLLIFMLLAISPCVGIAQNSMTPADPVGSPDYTPAIRDKENVNLSSGDMSLFLPVLNLPQRNGSSITLGYYYNSSQWRMNTYVAAFGQSNYISTAPATYPVNMYWPRITPTANSQFPYDSPLQVNLPSLSASIEFEGETGHCYASQEVCGAVPTYCMENFVFTDWNGDMHSFSYGGGSTLSCNIVTEYDPGAPGNFIAFPEAKVEGLQNLESFDLSYYHLDTSNPADIVVTAKDGTKYHFTNIVNPFPNPQLNYSWNETTEDYSQTVFSSMVDPNGNAITVSTDDSGGGYEGTVYKLTDTTGKVVTISSSGMSYKDSTGTSRQISVMPVNPDLPGGASQSDSWTFPHFACSIHNDVSGQTQSVLEATTAPVVHGYDALVVSFPEADGQHQRTYKATFDGLSRLIKISYPSGGYTRYDYTQYEIPAGGGNPSCSWDVSEISHKYECNNASSSCSSEATTSYVPSTAMNSDGTTYYPELYSAPNNDAMDVTDPVGQRTRHIFVYPYNSALNTCGTIPLSLYFQGPHVFPQEGFIYSYDANGTLVHTVQQCFAVLGGEVSSLPTVVTETFNDISPSISKQTHYAYQLDNKTEIDEYNFNGSVQQKTANVWNTTGIYAIDSVSHMLDRISSSTVTDSVTGTSTVTSYSYDGYGNVTSLHTSGSDGASASYSYTRIDPYHRVTMATDPGGNSTSYGYTDNWSNDACAVIGSSSYLTSVTNAKGQTRSFAYNSCTGTLGSSTDANSQTTAYAYDALGRGTAVCYPDAIGVLWSGGQCLSGQASVSNSYSDGIPNSVLHAVRLNAANAVQTNTIFDGYSRVIAKILSSDAQGADETDTTYDPLGRVATVSNPYRSSSDPTYGVTTYSYDWNNRKTVQMQPDNSKLQWCYDGAQDVLHPQAHCSANASTYSSGTWVDFTDESGNHSQQVSDALGRLRAVLEPNPVSGALALETDYGYDGRGNLWNVAQIGNGGAGDIAHNRSFHYDSFSRLLTSANPESGTVSYIYPSTTVTCGHLGDIKQPCSKTDARGVITGYTYDNLNRLIAKTYSNAPMGSLSSCYQYDSAMVGVGRIGAEWSQAGSCPSTAPSLSAAITERLFTAYDAMGRILSEQQCVKGHCSAVTPPPCPNAALGQTYCYNLAGNQTWSSAWINDIPVVNSGMLSFASTYDMAGRLSGVTSNWNDTTHPGGLFAGTYTPAGANQNLFFGPSITVNKTYDNRLRPSTLSAIHP